MIIVIKPNNASIQFTADCIKSKNPSLPVHPWSAPATPIWVALWSVNHAAIETKGVAILAVAIKPVEIAVSNFLFIVLY
jgi:hypothetical protein